MVLSVGSEWSEYYIFKDNFITYILIGLQIVYFTISNN